MKAITSNLDISLCSSKAEALENSKAIREGIIMNLFSNIMVKDNDKSAVSKKVKFNHHEDFNTYKKLEYKNNHSESSSSNQYFDLMCNRLM
jgi:hypothetical protein